MTVVCLTVYSLLGAQQIRVNNRRNRIIVVVEDHLAEGEHPLPYYQKLMFLRRVLPGVAIKVRPWKWVSALLS